MLRKRGLLAVVATVVATVLVAFPAAASTQDSSRTRGTGVVTEVDLRLQRDGGLSVTERVSVPPGTTVHRTVPLRVPTGDGAERVFTVTDAGVTGHGSVRVREDGLVMTFRAGTSTLSYSVDGTVAGTGRDQQLHWRVSGGWSVPVSKVTASFIAPRPAQAIECRVGRSRTASRCDQFQIGHGQEVRVTHFDLRPGRHVNLTITLPAGTVPVNARFEEASGPARAFALTPAGSAGLAGLALLLAGGFGTLWYTRGRDARVLADDVGPVDVLLDDADGGVTFASPDGVLPGQVGTVIDEHVDVVDVTATVIDLAVRNYLWIEEIPGEMQARDWRIVRLNPPDDSLRRYERAVYELVLGQQQGARPRRQVLLSELRTGATLDLTSVREGLYSDVVDKNWFSRRPDTERSLFWWSGIGLALVGVGLTVVLALTTTLALLGVGVVLGGIALTAGARLMPARARRGSALVAQMRGLREYLHGVSAESIAEPDRETVFSRSLPYAMVLGETERWLAEFAELDPGADGTPGLYWYAEQDSHDSHVVPNLRRFRTHFPMLVSTMDGVLAQAGHLRTLK